MRTLLKLQLFTIFMPCSRYVRSSENLRCSYEAADQRLHVSEEIKTANHSDVDARTYGPMYRKDSGSVVSLQRGTKLSDTTTSNIESFSSKVSVLAFLFAKRVEINSCEPRAEGPFSNPLHISHSQISLVEKPLYMPRCLFNQSLPQA